MNVNVTIYHAGKKSIHTLPEGSSTGALLREAGYLAQTCGVGKCGKCRIKANSKVTKQEEALLSKEDLDAGIRLACYTKAQENLEITVIEQLELTVLTQFIEQKYDFVPLVESVLLSYDAPHLDDQRDDLRRILDAAECNDHVLSFVQLSELSNALHNGEDLHVLRQNGVLLGKANSSHHLAMAVDIGTTTLAAMLIDLRSKRILAVRGEANTQAPWGADVISRIQQTIPEITPEYHDNAKAMQKAVLQQLDGLCSKLLHDAKLSPKVNDVSYMTIAGNTTMMHLLCGLSAIHISRAPFIPLTMEGMRLHGSALGLRSQAQIFLMPSIAAYIGADIVAALLAANAHIAQKPFLLLDLGTNAEIALGYGGKFLACSAAAGPCFEGASLSCGVPGQVGAINAVYADSDNDAGFSLSTIGNATPKGLCGSGVLDTIALLLDSENLDETGLLEAQDTATHNPIAKGIQVNENGQSFFVLADNVHLTQRDIREVQLAKAAVRAGIHVLLNEAQLSIDDIDTLYIAGGFGSAMNPQSAAKIGLIPQELLPRTKVLGNAAGLGVVRYATEQNVQEHVGFITNNTRYLELSALPSFTDIYVENMIFEAT